MVARPETSPRAPTIVVVVPVAERANLLLVGQRRAEAAVAVQHCLCAHMLQPDHAIARQRRAWPMGYNRMSVRMSVLSPVVVMEGAYREGPALRLWPAAPSRGYCCRSSGQTPSPSAAQSRRRASRISHRDCAGDTATAHAAGGTCCHSSQTRSHLDYHASLPPRQPVPQPKPQARRRAACL